MLRKSPSPPRTPHRAVGRLLEAPLAQLHCEAPLTPHFPSGLYLSPNSTVAVYPVTIKLQFLNILTPGRESSIVVPVHRPAAHIGKLMTLETDISVTLESRGRFLVFCWSENSAGRFLRCKRSCSCLCMLFYLLDVTRSRRLKLPLSNYLLGGTFT